jgi:hypothetical protein
LRENNFEIIEIIPNGNYFEYLAQELIRIPSCANKYSNRISIVDKLLILKFLFTLKKLSKHNKGSENLLCFGIHVLAKKMSNQTNNTEYNV